jgi:DNA replication protein DnaC
MDNLDFVRCKSLNCIPQKKLREALDAVEQGRDSLRNKNIKAIAINRYAESNIPIEYWYLKMERDFKGDPRLLIKYNDYIADLKTAYQSGASVCFAGSHGVGKTMVLTGVLKKAVVKGYSCLYTTLSDIVNVLTQSEMEAKSLARRELTMVDFLVVDEADPRFIQSENAADLYARSFESIFRARSQNKLPTLMGTNSPNLVESFKGQLRESIDSLMQGYMEVFRVLPGKDVRKEL